MRGEGLLHEAVDSVVDIVELGQVHVAVELRHMLLNLKGATLRI